MKLTEAKLKKLIVEVINEVRIAPEPPSVLSSEELSKIHDLINSGDESYINMAKSIIDGKKGDPNYVDQYIAHQEVGDLEKLGNQVADMYEPSQPVKPFAGDLDAPRPLKPGFSEEDVLAIDSEAYKLVRAKAAKPGYETARYDSPYGEITISPYEAMMDRYYRTRNPRPEDKLNEVRIAPDYDYFATDDQITKIHSLIDSGNPESIEMAKSILDALGASPSYFDDYMRNQEVGEVEKLANKHGAGGFLNDPHGLDTDMDVLIDYFTELDKFEDREVGRGRTHPDPAKEFYDRYQKVADKYKPNGDE